MRGERRALAATSAALAIDACAIAIVALAAPVPGWPIAAMLHVGAAAVAGTLASEPSRRWLAAAMVFALPALGAALAALAALVPGRGGDELLALPDRRPRSESGVAVARRLTEGVPICDSLLADAESRRAALAALQREPDARAIALLRWAVAHAAAEPDLGVEAALVLEELSTRTSRRADQACRAMARAPCREHAVAAADELAAQIHNGLAEPALAAALAARARSFYARAAALDPARAGELAEPLARLELAVLRPEAALALLEDALSARPGDSRLLALYRDAAHAARRFELLPRDALDIDRPALRGGHDR